MQNCKMANTAEIVIGLLCITTGLVNHVQSQSRYDVRLVDGSLYNNGRVEIFYNAEWVTVCGDNWGDDEAQIVCSQLGYDSGNPVARNNAYYGPGSGSIYSVVCTLFASDLSACYFVESSPNSCTHYDDAGVQCESQYDVRLVGGDQYDNGRVEIYYNAEWVTVCDDNWGDDEAQIVCRQLGYNSWNAVARNNAYYGPGSGSIYNVYCFFSESDLYHLSSCSFVEASSYRCTHNDDVGVQCGDGTTTASSSSPSTSVRLVGGASADEGRVEIYYNGEWGTVCDDSWDDNDAEVVCRQLGLSTDSAVAWTSTGTYGQGTGPILLDNVNCYGYEYSLTTCASNGWYNNDCSHSEDAGVRCAPRTSPRVIGTMSFVGISLFLLLVVGIVVVCRVCNTKPNPLHIVSHGTELTPINNGSTTTNQYTASPSAVIQ